MTTRAKKPRCVHFRHWAHRKTNVGANESNGDVRDEHRRGHSRKCIEPPKREDEHERQDSVVQDSQLLSSHEHGFREEVSGQR